MCTQRDECFRASEPQFEIDNNYTAQSMRESRRRGIKAKLGASDKASNKAAVCVRDEPSERVNKRANAIG
jgi:hypothetical protein